MDWSGIINNLFWAVVPIVISFVGFIFTKYLKAKIGDEAYKEVCYWVSIAVNAAEMKYKESGKGKEKKAYVLNFMRGKGITITEEELDALIEATVKEIVHDTVKPLNG